MARFVFNMPDVGEGLAEVEIVQWKIDVGDDVTENQDIADIETDKSVVSMPAPATGRIVELAAAAGDRVAVGALLLVMEVADDGATEDPEAESRSGDGDAVGPAAAAASGPSGAPIAATPSARRLARELGVQLVDVRGSGPRGRITPEDVQSHADTAAAVAPEQSSAEGSAPAAGVQEVPLRGIRRRTAETLSRSYREIPHVAGFHEFIVPRLVEERERLKGQAEARGINVTVLALVVRAVALGLHDHPWLNAELDEDRSVVLLRSTYDIGIAMATAEGLVVPVVRSADQRDVFGIASELSRLGQAAESGTLTAADMRGGTFTISNVGPAGGNYGTSLIRPPEVAILGLGCIRDRAVVEDGRVVARPVLPVSLTFDHRVVDGEQALAFVRTLRDHLEHDPGGLGR